MTWITAKKYIRIKNTQPKITISGITKQIYFNAYIKRHIIADREKVIIRYNNESKMLAFQPVNEGDNTYNLIKRGKNDYGLLVHGTNILAQFGIEVNKKLSFIPHWDSKIEWLTINMNNKGGDDNERS